MADHALGAFDPVAWWSGVDPERTAIREPAHLRTWSYAALHTRADAWSGWLRARGVGAGDRIAVLAGNRTETVALLFGATRIGAALVPLNWRLAAPELAGVLANCRPVLLIGERRFRPLAEGAIALPESAGARPMWHDLDLPPGDGPVVARPPTTSMSLSPSPTSTAPALLLYTSGSTGTPKGVMVSHAQLHWNAAATVAGWGLGALDVAPVTTPLFHTAAWGVFLLPLLHVGGCVVMYDGFDPVALFELMRAEATTVAFLVPTQLDRLIASPAWGTPLPALRWLVVGGAPCHAWSHARGWEAGYRVREAYGLTEYGPNCTATTDADAQVHPGTVGHPLPGLEMRAVDQAGQPVPPGTPGALQLRGPAMFSGYHAVPEVTAEAFTADGWFRTGDMAALGADGRWAIRGRRTEMYISGGENVFPGEVEAALRSCAGVVDACVLAVPHEEWGEVGCALLVRAGAPELLTEAALRAELATRIARYKMPQRIVFVDAIPHLGSGKPDRLAAARLL